MWQGSAVPRAYLLTDITTIYTIAQFRYNFGSNLSLIFDCLIGNTLVGIYSVGAFYGTGGTGCKAAATVATVLRNRFIVLQLQIDNQFTQKKIGPLTWNNQQRIFPTTQCRLGCPKAFQNGASLKSIVPLCRETAFNPVE